MNILTWYGGKARILTWVLEHLPEDVGIYVEPCGGAGTVMLNRKPAPVEVYNDIDGNIVELFRAIQDPRRFRRLFWRLKNTLYSRAEFARAIDILKDPDAPGDDRAWAIYVACNQGFAGKAKHVSDWGITFGSRDGMMGAVAHWWRRMEVLPKAHERFRRVAIESKDALYVIRRYDREETLFYIDPPYAPDTHSTSQVPYPTMSPEWHEELVEMLLAAKGRVALSGYETDIYKPLADAGWRVYRKPIHSAAAGRTRYTRYKKGETPMRTEVLWTNYDASVSLGEWGRRGRSLALPHLSLDPSSLGGGDASGSPKG